MYPLDESTSGLEHLQLLSITSEPAKICLENPSHELTPNGGGVGDSDALDACDELSELDDDVREMLIGAVTRMALELGLDLNSPHVANEFRQAFGFSPPPTAPSSTAPSSKNDNRSKKANRDRRNAKHSARRR